MSESDSYQLITSSSQLDDFLEYLSGQNLITFDTEFVSEDCFEPELCLIQVGTEDRIGIIDPLAFEGWESFWEFLAEGDHISVAHAARQEYLFCRKFSGGKGPANLFDVQIASGMIGLEYPAAYSTLVNRFCKTTISKGETRTDWRKRSLSPGQLRYAAADVQYLPAIYHKLVTSLNKQDRMDWIEDEMSRQIDRFVDKNPSEKWRKVSGISSLRSRELSIVRELYQWRMEIAQDKNIPAKRVLRDDMIVEIARLKSSDPSRIKNLRGLSQRRNSESLEVIAERVGRALDLPEDKMPKPNKLKSHKVRLTQVIQFANTALGIICRKENIAPSLVGTMQDIRDLVGWRLGICPKENKPLLANGWREKIVGQTIDQLLEGKLSIQITDPKSDFPLEFSENDR